MILSELTVSTRGVGQSGLPLIKILETDKFLLMLSSKISLREGVIKVQIDDHPPGC